MGGRFAFLGSQFRLEVGSKEYFVDLLLFHRALRCLVALDLKIGEFKPEFVGKMQFDLAALDDLVRLEDENPSIGIILCRSKERALVEYALRDSRKPLGVATYRVVKRLPQALAKGAAEQQQAEQEGIELRDRVRASYPFHPALIDLMRERWAAIPEFQRTRGALRFLAACLGSAHQAGTSPACAGSLSACGHAQAGVAAGRRAVLGPGDVPMHDPAVRLAFFKEVGQQADFQAVLEHDLIGANARARRPGSPRRS